MSTILDALKKSEQERKLNKLPTLTDMVAPQEATRWPFYIGLALVLLAISLVALAYVIWSAKAEISTVQTAKVNSVALLAQSPSSAAQSLIAADAAGAKDPMLVNVVSYSTAPALSFAMVNGKMVREGDFIEPGLKLEEILLDAVIFNARGKKITRSP